MIRRNGNTAWANIHVTTRLQLEDLIDIDNSSADGTTLTYMGILEQAAREVNGLINEAKTNGKQLRAIGSAWALSNIQRTNNWLLNTRLLNECFDPVDTAFHSSYPAEKRKYLVITQCGVSIAQLNTYLEFPENTGKPARCLKTAGIGAGQTVTGAVSGNTHGAAVNFGALPEFVAAIQLCTGTGKSLWIERADYPVMSDNFIAASGSVSLRDNDVFNSALVSFGSFGIITAYAIETDPIHHINFPPIKMIAGAELQSLLTDPSYYSRLQHLEFVFNPYSADEYYLIEGTRMPFETGHPVPQPLWIITSPAGYAVGDRLGQLLLSLPLVPAKKKSDYLFKLYLKKAVLSDVRGTPGQLYTATVTYMEGTTETALTVSTDDALRAINIIKECTAEKKLPLTIQSRVVGPGKTIFGFTNHTPTAVVFEYGILHKAIHAEFEAYLTGKLIDAGIRYKLHWSKNSGIDPARLKEMYGTQNIDTWKRCRNRVFNNDSSLKDVFNFEDIRAAGLATP